MALYVIDRSRSHIPSIQSGLVHIKNLLIQYFNSSSGIFRVHTAKCVDYKFGGDPERLGVCFLVCVSRLTVIHDTAVHKKELGLPWLTGVHVCYYDYKDVVKPCD
jgi:hypothetical protein